MEQRLNEAYEVLEALGVENPRETAVKTVEAITGGLVVRLDTPVAGVGFIVRDGEA